jgi:tetratricopeptide (TPR) repeat protein
MKSVSFSTFKASIFIKKYEDDDLALSFLRFVSSFDFVSLDFIASAEASLGTPLTDYLDRFVTDSVCETIGNTGQYFRVNEVIRDAVIRDRTELSHDYRKFLKLFVSKFSKDYDVEYYDVSEYHVAIKEALSSGVELPESLLIPAHFLKTMKDLYNSGSYRDVVALADRVLMRANYYDDHTSQDIRYYLCQSLARLRDTRFTAEVQNIDGPEHDFLFGFYYRLKGQFDKAIDRYQRAMKFSRTEQRSRRELVFVMTTVEAYEDALSLAKENYERYPSNPFIVQAYFDCLIHTSSEPECSDKLQDVLLSLEQIRGARAKEMFDTLSAKFEYQFGDKKKSFDMIDRAVRAHLGVVYPVLTALDMSMNEMDLEGISICINRLESGRLGSGHKLAILKAKVLQTALDGDKARAERMIARDLTQMNPNASEKLLRRVNSV